MSTPTRLLAVDDEVHICELVRDLAEGLGFEVATASSHDDFMAGYRDHRPNVITLDLQMPDVDGVELLRYLADEQSKARVVLMSGMDRKILDTAKRLAQGRGLNVHAVVQKPFQLDELEATLSETMQSESAVTTLELRRALKQRQLTVHYQPKLNLTGGSGHKIEGVEALVRWQSPVRGLLWPGSFIPLAEQSGLILPLTDYVIETVIGRLGMWHANDLPLTASVNLPAQSLGDLNLPDRLAAMMREQKLDPGLLTLEVTESSAMADVNKAMDILTRLRIKGFPISMDDFGTGYSSLSQLHRLPFSELKIDKEFVQQLETNEDNRTIVKTVLDLGKNLGLEVCAEGIEDEGSLDYLVSHGCDAGQGYHFSKAVASDELVPLVRTWGMREVGRANGPNRAGEFVELQSG